MIWGGFASDGTRVVTRVNEKLNAIGYVEVLQEHLLPLDLPNRGMLMQQDNAPAHKAATTMRFLREHNIETLDWPPQSPDLNLIENMWGCLKEKLESLEIATFAELEAAVIREWGNIPAEVVNNIIDSMPRRMAAVIAARGANTKY